MAAPHLLLTAPRHEGSVRAIRAATLLCVAIVTSACATVSRQVQGAESAPPPTFMRLATEAETQRSIPVREGLGKAGAFRSAVEYLTSKGYTIEARDQAAGFALTGWQATLARDGVPDLRYRTRLMLKFIGDDWRELQLRAEANWRSGDEWQVGVDRAVLDEIAGGLRTRLGPQ